MNIFRLDNNVVFSAKMHCDKHISKMSVEQTQILHTSLHTHGLRQPWLYRPFNPKHPSCIWAMKTFSNFMWTAHHGLALCDEYQRRYNKIHKCREKIILAIQHASIVPEGQETPQLLAMPKQFQSENVVHSYKLYYAACKFRFATWNKLANEPEWWQEYRDYVVRNNLEVINDKDDGVKIK